MCSGWLKLAKLLELTNHRANMDHRRIFHEIEVRSSTLPNCLNYRVMERTGIIGSRIFHEFRVLEPNPNCLN